MNEIKASDIRLWQNELMKQDYAATYLKTVNNQLAALFNYAMKYYDLQNNPCRRAGSIGKSKADEMKFWTKQEFKQFLEGVNDKRQSYIAFQMLYWTGMRIGELMALTYNDIDLEKRTVSINKSYQWFNERDVITPPKTPKSNRSVNIPKFLTEELKEYISRLYGLMPDDRMFQFTKAFLEHEMIRGVKNTGVKKIRLHDLRHTFATLGMEEEGISLRMMQKLLGHANPEITMKVYWKLLSNKEDEAMNRMDDLF